MTLRFNYFRWIAQMMICVMLSGFVVAEVPGVLPKGELVKLGSDQFEERQKAYAELKKWSAENLKVSPELLYKIWAKSEKSMFQNPPCVLDNRVYDLWRILSPSSC